MGEQFGFQAGNCGFQAQMNCHSLIPNESFQPFLHLLLSHFFCSFRSSRTSICCSVGKQCRSSAGKQKLLFPATHSKLLEMRDPTSQGKGAFPLKKAGNSSSPWIFPKEAHQQHRDREEGFIPSSRRGFIPNPTGNSRLKEKSWMHPENIL